MSRSIVVLAGIAFAILGLGPILMMAARVDLADLTGLLGERRLGLLGRTLLLGSSASAIAVLLGAPFGFLVSRSDMPGAKGLGPLGVVPLLLPPLFIAITWTSLCHVRGAPAAILILAAGTFPVVALFTAVACKRIDASIEEAALLAGGWRTVLRVELPLVAPAVLCGACIAFVFAINDFAVPDFVSSVGPKFNVYADEVFTNWMIDKRTGRAVASALPLVALTLAFLLPALALRSRGALSTVKGGFRRPAPFRLGRARWPAFAFCSAVVGITCILPIGTLIYDAGGGARGWSREGLAAAFSRALELSRGDLANSICYSALAGLVAVPIALALGHAAARAHRGLALESLFVLPIAVPAILFGIGEIALWNHASTAELYNSGALVVLLHAGRFLPLPLLIMVGAVTALDRQLEQAAALAGAGPAKRLTHVVAPILLPSILGSWALVFVLSMRELDAAILVPAANHTVIFRVFNQIHFGRDDFVAALCLLVVFFLLLPGIAWSLFARPRAPVMP